MPRTARIDIPNLLQHVIVRGIEKRDIFKDDEDRRRFLTRFSELLVTTGTGCLAWALMSNHFHLLLRPRLIPLATFMRRLLTGYAVTFNLRHGRSGHLFQNRYKSIVCEEEGYLLELVRYIHLNPLRAAIVSNMEELDRFGWCGHAVLMGKRDFPGQATAEVLERFGKPIRTSRCRYRSFVEDGIAMGRRNDLVGGGGRPQKFDGPEERELRDARILGRDDFVDQLLPDVKLNPQPARVPLAEIIERVRIQFDIPLRELMSQSRSRRIANVRSIICYIAFATGHRGVDIARQLGITGSGVTIAAQRGEKAIVGHPEFRLMLGDS